MPATHLLLSVVASCSLWPVLVQMWASLVVRASAVLFSCTYCSFPPAPKPAYVPRARHRADAPFVLRLGSPPLSYRVPASHRRTKIWHRLDTTVKLQATWSICLKFRASHKADVAWAPQLPFPDESESGHRTFRCTLNSPELELAPARRLFVHPGLSFLPSGVVAFRAVDLDRWLRWAMSNIRALLALRFKHIV